MSKSKLTYSQYVFAGLTMLTASVCLAEDPPILPQKTNAPQSVRRVHYVDPIYSNPPIPFQVAILQTDPPPYQELPFEFLIDPGPDSPNAWTLDQVITATLTADPVLRIGKAEISQARAELLGSAVFPNPSLEIAGDTLPFKRSSEIEPEFLVQMEMPIDWFLFAKRAAEMNSAKWDVRHSQAEYADLVRQRITDTATAFYDVLEAKALLAATLQDLDILVNFERMTYQSVAAGNVSHFELDRIRLELFTHQQGAIEDEAVLNTAKARLWAMLGRSDRDASFDVRGNLEDPLTLTPYPIEEAFELARQNRPDIRALRIQISKAMADREAERRNAFPEVSMKGGYVKEYLNDGRENGWGIGISMTVPVFDRNQGGRARSQAALRQSNYELQAGLIELRAEVEEADQQLRTAYLKAATFALEAVWLARRLRDNTIRSYELGNVPLIDALDADRTYMETHRTYISSRADYWRAVYVYNSVIGQ